jgi:hypothetical protein
MMPENSASMADAARTRENEGACFCDDCNLNPEKCGSTIESCESELREQIGDQKFEERRDGAL